MYPNFCVTEKVRRQWNFFNQVYTLNGLFLYNKERKKSMPYYMPLLETVDCFTENTIYNADRSVIHRAQIDSEMIGGRIFFRAGGVKCNCILGRLDFVESLLKKKCTWARFEGSVDEMTEN